MLKKKTAKDEESPSSVKGRFPDIVRNEAIVLVLFAVFAIGAFLVGRVSGFSEVSQELDECVVVPHLSFGYTHLELRSFIAAIDAIGAKATYIKELRFDYLYILCYAVVGVLCIRKISLPRMANTAATRKNGYSTMAVLVLADLVENSLLLFYISNYEDEPIGMICRFGLSVASVATIVKIVALALLLIWIGDLLLRSIFLRPLKEKLEARPVNRKRRNIVLFSDGTGNSAFKARGTNVFKLYEALDYVTAGKGESLQIAFYDDGVGTDSNKIICGIGGAFGIGLAGNVKQLYKELVLNYLPGDKIFLFGFSRGAFTARTLGGMIAHCGVLKNTDELGRKVEEAYQYYRNCNPSRIGQWLLGKKEAQCQKGDFTKWQKDNCYRLPEIEKQEEPLIRFIGVWDTVDAYGLPWDGLADLINSTIIQFKFQDKKPSRQVKRACHAIAIDDERDTFHPVLWEENGSTQLEQVWFPGVHSNVGGGYQRQGISLIALRWMMKKAQEEELRYDKMKQAQISQGVYYGDKIYDSRAGFSSYYRYKPRDIAKLCNDCGIALPCVHESAINRALSGIDDYNPGNIPGDVIVVDDEGDRIQELQDRLGQLDCDDTRSLLGRVRKAVFWKSAFHYILLAASAVLFIILWINVGGAGDAAAEFSRTIMLLVAALALIRIFNFLPSIPSLLGAPTYIMKKRFRREWDKIRQL